MQQSTVKWFDAKKGYGFISHPDGGDDVFVHYSDIDTDDDFKTLHADQPVRFEMNDGPKGLNASAVVPLDDGEEASTTENGTSSESSSEPPAEQPSESYPEIDPSELDPTAEVDPVSSS